MKQRHQNQDDWKRTQVRLPAVLYEDIALHASKHSIPLNHAMIELIDRGLTSLEKPNQEKRKIIFTSWNAVSVQEQYCSDKNPLEYNEAVRMDCSRFLTEFIQKHPSYEIIKLDFKKRSNRKGKEIVYGVYIWYSYPANE